MTDQPPGIINDREIEAEVDEIIRKGAKLPRWGWPVPAPYNGATGRERIYVWQQNRIGDLAGLLPPLGQCSVCQKRPADGRHGEIYFRPFALVDICRSCHARIHRRFGNPARWEAFLEEVVARDGWGHSLLTVQVEREEALRIAEKDNWLEGIKSLRADREASRQK